MFLDRRLVTGGAASRSTFKLESDHQDLVLRLLAKRAGVPNYKIDARAPATHTADGAPYTVEELDAKGSLAADPTGLSRLISPFTPTDFYTEQYWRRRPMVFRGPARRFTNLLNWRDLNEILSRRDLRAPQLRILEGGREIPGSMYEGNNLGVGTRQPEMWATNVSGRKLLNLARNGATIAINQMGGLHAPTGELVRQIEGSLGVYVTVNLYASWRSYSGFPTHWDGQDAFIIQAAGEKEWQLFGETRRHANWLDTEPTPDPPADPVWTDNLTAGDVLYVPRGWWHNARVPETNNGAGSLHLTLTMAPVTSIWVMRWLSGKLLDDELGRRDVPLSADDDARTDYFNRLAARITELLAEGFGERFVKDVRAAWSESLETDISTYVEPWRDPSWDRYLVRLKGRELAMIEPNASMGFFTLKANGTALDLDLRCRDLISTLLDRESVAVGELKELHTGFPPGFIDDFIKQIVKDDVAAVRPAADSGRR